jgi:hypothetical protein
MEAVAAVRSTRTSRKQYRLRMNRGERISDDELEVIADEHGRWLLRVLLASRN